MGIELSASVLPSLLGLLADEPSQRALGFGFWVLIFRLWALVFELWSLGSGPWSLVMVISLLTLGFGLQVSVY